MSLTSAQHAAGVKAALAEKDNPASKSFTADVGPYVEAIGAAVLAVKSEPKKRKPRA